MKLIFFSILFILINHSFSKNLFFQWRLTDTERIQLQKEAENLIKTNKDLYEALIETNEPTLTLSRYTFCQKCQIFLRTLLEIKKKYGYLAIYTTLKEQICPILQSLNVASQEECIGYVDGYMPILIENSFSRYIDNYYLCEKINLCPSEHPKKFINVDDYARKILKGKPKREKEEYDPNSKMWRMLQVTDLHLDLNYTEGASVDCATSICCRNPPSTENETNFSGKYGYEGKCDISKELVESFVDDAFTRDVDFIIWTGDNGPHDVYQASQDYVYTATREIKKMLDKKFKNSKNIPIYYCLGNHEKFPNDAFHDEESEMLSNYAEIFKDYLDEEAYQSFKKYGYYSMLHPNSNLRIISLNCLVCDSFNFNMLNSTKMHTKNMINWLENELKKAEKNYEYVYILNHFPLNGEFTMTECAKRFQALFDRYEYVVRGIFSGHTHRDDIECITNYFNNDRNNTIHLNFVAPQLTTYSHKLPSYRIYTLDSKYKRIIDYEQYRFNLTLSNEKKMPFWFLSYRGKELYKVDDMTQYNKIRSIDPSEGYVLRQYSDSKSGIEYQHDEEKIKFAKCILTTNNYQELYRCAFSKLEINKHILYIISNFFIGPFEED